MRTTTSLVALLVLLGLFCGGCNQPTEPSPESPAAETSHAEPDDHAGHDHGDLGPHGGHLVEVTPDDYHVEWLHEDESNLITAMILDNEAENEVPIAASAITIETVINETTVAYQLEAVDASEEDPPRAARFEIISEPLLTSLKVGTGVDAHVKFTVGDQSYQGEIEHHDHSHHGHAH